MVVVVLVYLFVSSAGDSVVLIPQGETLGAGQGADWAVGVAGTLHGAFTVVNGPVELCFADYDMFDYAYAHGQILSQCPSNATYSSGFVDSGTVSVHFDRGPIYLLSFVPVGWVDGDPDPVLNWTSALEFTAD